MESSNISILSCGYSAKIHADTRKWVESMSTNIQKKSAEKNSRRIYGHTGSKDLNTLLVIFMGKVHR